MTSLRRSCVRGVCLLLLGLALLAGWPAHADDKWYELYQSALKAIAGHKWGEAEKKLKGALETGPPSGRQVRMYGVRFIDYLPEYQLGIVYFNQQRYADALEQLAKVQASGLVTKADAEFPTLTDMSELCRIRTAGKPGDGQKESETLVRYARDLMGRNSLDEARRALDSAAAKTPGSAEVAAARDELARLQTEARVRAEERNRAEAARRADDDRFLEAAEKAVESGRYAEARSLLAKISVAGVAEPRAKRVSAEADLLQGIADVTALVARGDLDGAEQQRQRLASAHPGDLRLTDLAARIELGRRPVSPPEPSRGGETTNTIREREAFEAFYSGDYRSAATRFEALAATARSGRERNFAYAACSWAGAGLLDGSDDARKQLDRARALLAQAGSAGARLISRDRLISPGIVRVLKTDDPALRANMAATPQAPAN